MSHQIKVNFNFTFIQEATVKNWSEALWTIDFLFNEKIKWLTKSNLVLIISLLFD